MNNAVETPKLTQNFPLFFGITIALSIPIYILGAFAPQEMVMLIGLLLGLTPITAGVILTFRENGSDGAKVLLKRSFDYQRTTHKIWYLPIIIFWPILFILAYGVMLSLGETAPDPLFPTFAAPILFIVFFIFAVFEEVGWMGYAFDPMQNRWNALKASLILGVIWAAWHLPLYIQAGHDFTRITAQMLSLLAIRILIVFIYNNTGKSVFATILFHAMYNLCTIVFPSFYISSGQLITSILIIITGFIVVLLWDLDTLTQIRFKQTK